jgi:hypothetical protein
VVTARHVVQDKDEKENLVAEEEKFPLRLSKPSSEWLVELIWRIDESGVEGVCGLFHSKNEADARSFYDNAHRILSCWYVDIVWQQEGKPTRRAMRDFPRSLIKDMELQEMLIHLIQISAPRAFPTGGEFPLTDSEAELISTILEKFGAK